MPETNNPALNNAIATLLSAGATGVWILYSGSGDSGDIEDCGVTSAEDLGQAVQIALDWDTPSTTSQIDSLYSTHEELFRDVLIELVNEEFGGWENNDGATGAALLDLRTLEVLMEHDWNVTSTERQTARASLSE